jgi:hypothetical protein
VNVFSVCDFVCVILCECFLCDFVCVFFVSAITPFRIYIKTKLIHTAGNLLTSSNKVPVSSDIKFKLVVWNGFTTRQRWRRHQVQRVTHPVGVLVVVGWLPPMVEPPFNMCLSLVLLGLRVREVN